MIHEHLISLTERLPIYESRVRRHEPGGVHKMRVTLRRLRSVLTTAAPLFDAAVVSSLREELKWLAGELGDARDLQVVRARLTAGARTVEQRAVARMVERDLSAAQATGVQDGIAALDSERYDDLMRALNGFLVDPPGAQDLEGSTDEVLRRRVEEQWKRLLRKARSAAAEEVAEDREVALHEVRKAAKRLRYSAETLQRAYGDDAKRLALGAKRIQSELGEVQDSAVARGVLLEMSGRGSVDTETVFVLGELSGQERLLSAEAEARYAKHLSKLSRKRNGRWLR